MRQSVSSPGDTLRSRKWRTKRWLPAGFLLLALAFAAPAGALAAGDAAPDATPAGPVVPASCPVTIPNGSVPPFGNLGFFPGPVFHGEHGIWASFDPDGTIAVQPDMRSSDGSYGVKFLWYHDQRAKGKLEVTGTYLGGDAPPLDASVPDGYGSTGYQASGLEFARLGCWRITASAGDASMTFTIWLYEGQPTRLRSLVTSPTPPPFCHVTRQPSRVSPVAVATGPVDTLAVGNEHLAVYLPPDGSAELTYRPTGGARDAWTGFALQWWQDRKNEFDPVITGEQTAAYGGAGDLSYTLGAVAPLTLSSARVAFSFPGCWQIELTAGQTNATVTVWLWTKELPPLATPVATPAA